MRKPQAILLSVVVVAVLTLAGVVWRAYHDRSPVCRRLTMMRTEPKIGLFLPHWHLIPGDLIIRGDDTATVVFHTGERLVMKSDELSVSEEECR